MKKSSLDKTSTQYRQGTRILIVFVFIAVLFISIGIYLTYIELFKGDEYTDNPANQRQWAKEQNTLRGTIYDTNGEVLAHSEKTDGTTQERIYNYPELFAHIIGYNSRVYGKSQLELTYNKNLAGLSQASNITDIKSALADEKRGDDIELTISLKLQQKAKEMMRGKHGAVVALDPDSGEVLCMVSNPSFNPSSKSLAKEWDKLSSSEDSPFLNRATLGLYPPGSIIKTIILSAAIENGLEDMEIDDKGTIEINGVTFTNTKSKAHGKIGLEEAYNVSSNVAFMTVGVKLGDETVRKYYDKFRIGRGFDFDIPMYKSRLGYDNKMTDDQLAMASIGQGNVLVTPLQMAMMTSTIANGGEVVAPYLVKKVVNSTGVPVKSGRKQSLGRAIRQDTAEKVKNYMVSTVKTGTASRASVRGIDVAGKTGTAENEKAGKNHAWFVGFAPADNPQIAVAVILEYDGGTGGGNAAPIASELFNLYINGN